jgi:hypothetical protein
MRPLKITVLTPRLQWLQRDHFRMVHSSCSAACLASALLVSEVDFPGSNSAQILLLCSRDRSMQLCSIADTFHCALCLQIALVARVQAFSAVPLTHSVLKPTAIWRSGSTSLQQQARQQQLHKVHFGDAVSKQTSASLLSLQRPYL